ncbi:DUF6622 family protein [Ferrovibrio sp.]|uniref:DUF6622 family protein n=1 Tax=Ferrovibrio sp. TaxID=1917215 RepID=UPI0026342080|nr:DUF6622 family protein [Ferrovibrio sp.]
MTSFLAITGGILGGTPVWVWGLLALLTWLGSLSLRQRSVPLRRIAVAPAVFIIWGLSGLAGRPFDAATIAVLWLGGLAGGGLAGLATGPRILSADPVARRITLPASGWPLARNLIFFFAHYVLNVLAAIQPAHKAALMQATIAVSGASAGYFIGWSLALWRRYRAAPDEPVTAAAL